MGDEDVSKLTSWLEGTTKYLRLFWRTNRLAELTQALDIMDTILVKAKEVEDRQRNRIQEEDFNELREFLDDLSLGI